MEKLCPKYNKELYGNYNIFIKPEARLNFPKVTNPVDFVYDSSKNLSHSDIFVDDGEVDKATSETRVQYKIPNSCLVMDNDGIRRKLYEKFLWKQMAREVVNELVDRNQVEDYCTEYDSKYYKSCSETVDLHLKQNEELHRKYPLYGTGSSAITYYSENIKYEKKNILHPFRRSSNITKPVGMRTEAENIF